MNPFQKISATIASGLRAQSFRMQISSENLANADTHGYRRKLVTFDAAIDERTRAETVKAARVSLDRAAGEKIYDPTHPLADPDGYVTASNVSPLIELADLREANRSYEAGLQAFRQAREMYSGLLDILKR
jgi:flagellar basal-body rod protein FlgC